MNQTQPAPDSHEIPAIQNLVDLLRYRAETSPNIKAFDFIIDQNSHVLSITYGELDLKARAIGSLLQRSFSDCDRILLTCHPGFNYIAAFFGCIYGGCIPVPAYPPRNKQLISRIQSIAKDARISAILGMKSDLHKLETLNKEGQTHFPLIDIEQIDHTLAETWDTNAPSTESIAFLQYTSGSTGNPKGVMVTHSNILHNLEMISNAFGFSPKDVGAIWLPPYHDMGLIGGILSPIYNHFPCVLMAPELFIQKPALWLDTISHYRATISGGPNFAYDLALRRVNEEQRKTLDLSCWRIAFSGAEPIHNETLTNFAKTFAHSGFNPRSFLPCYGLAESTLAVTCHTAGEEITTLSLQRSALSENKVEPASLQNTDARILVSCGKVLGDHIVVICKPHTTVLCQENEVGEILVSGQSVALGYWDKPDATNEYFHVNLFEKQFFRTGDLGFLRDGELFISGRIKDLIILSGRNHYAEDIENTVSGCHPALITGNCAAFSVYDGNEEKLAIVAEIDRQHRNPDFKEIYQSLCAQVSAQHEVRIHQVCFVGPSRIPKTSSGKIQRHACSKQLANGTLVELASYKNGSISKAPTISNNIEVKIQSPQNVPNKDDTVNNILGWLREYADTRLNSRLMDERRTIPPHVVLDFGQQGILGMQIPREYGGLGLGFRDSARIIEQLSAIDLTLANFVGLNNTLGMRPILQFGQQSIKDEFLPQLASGRILGAFALTERGAGSDPRRISTTATRNDDGSWRIRGTKVWSGSAAWAGVINVFAKNSSSDGMSAFAIPQGTKGMRMGPEELTMGLRGMIQNSVILEDATIDSANMLGESGSGMIVAQDTMSYARLGFGVFGLGGMKRCAQLMARYGTRRSIVTGRLIDNPTTISRLSEITARIQSLEVLVCLASTCVDENRFVPVEVFTVCKILGSEFLWQSADDLVQSLGGRGYIETNMVPQILRDARIMRVFEGPTEALWQYLGSRVMNASDDIHRFLKHELASSEISSQLENVTAQLKEKCTRDADTFGGIVPATQWANSLAGEILQWGILLAAVNKTKNGTNLEMQFYTEEWTRNHYQQALNRVIHNKPSERGLSTQYLEQHIAAFVSSIGDIEQCAPAELQPMDAYLLRGTMPQPVQDHTAPEAYHAHNNIQAHHIDNQNITHEQSDLSNATKIQAWLVHWIANSLRVEVSTIDTSAPLATLGVDSLHAIELMASLESEYNIHLDPTVAWDYPTIDALTAFLVHAIDNASTIKQSN